MGNSSADRHSPEAFGATLRGDSAREGAGPAAGATLPDGESDAATTPYERVVVGPVDIESDAQGPWTPETLSVVRPDQRYALAGEIERGGLGRILKAYDKRLGRQVVVKELLHNSSDSVKRFLREAKITAGLEHPSIVPVYDVGRWPDGIVFYSMKLVHGRSLEERIAATETFDERIALVPKLVAVAEAIAYAHNHGVIHRDLKPRNILVGSFGETLVIDWGLAKHLDDETADESSGGPFRIADPGLTAVGTIMGTPAFMAPEQARGEPVDARADVYALGSILYYMLSGSTPYDAEDGQSLIDCLLTGPPPPVIEREANIPPDLLAIIDKAMERNPADRYPSAKELAADLKRFQTGQLVGARQYSAVDLARRWLYRHRALVGLTAAAMFVLIAAGVVSVDRIARERDVARQKTAEVDQQRSRAVAAKREAVERGNRLVLLQAQSQLAEDPTAALAWLKQYPLDGKDWPLLVEIAEKATTAGYASAVWTAAQPLTSTDLSADGAYAAVASREEGVRVYDIETGVVTAVPNYATYALAVRYTAGDRLAIAGADRTIALWQRGDKAARELAQFKGELSALAASPDGRRLVAASAEGELRAFDVVDGRSWPLAGHRGPVRSAAFGPASERLLSGGEDGQLRLWSLDDGTAAVLRSGAAISWVQWAPDGNSVFVGLRSGAVEQRAVTGALVARFDGHRGPVVSGAMSPDGTQFATGSTDKTARVWSIADGTSQSVTFAGPVASIEYSPEGDLLALTGIDRTVRLLRGSGTVKELRGHDGPVWRATFSSDGKRLVTASEDRTLRVWPITPDRGETVGQHAGPITAVATSADGWTVATGGKDGSLGVFDARKDSWQSPGPAATAAVRDLVFLGFSSDLVALYATGEIEIWTRRAGTWSSERVGRVDGATMLASAPGSREVAVATSGGDVYRWDARGGLRAIASRGIEVVAARYSPNGDRLAIAWMDNTVSLFDGAGGETARLEGHGMRVRSMAFSPDGDVFATASYDGTVRLWRGARTEAILQGHLGPVLHVLFSRAGDRIATAGVDGIVRLWDVSTGEVVDQAPIGGAITTLASAPGGQQLAAAGYQGDMRLFDRTKRRPFILSSADDGVTGWLGFAPDGRSLLAATSRGHLRRWALDENGGVSAGGPPGEPEDVRRWLGAVSSAEIDGPEAPFPRSPVAVH